MDKKNRFTVEFHVGDPADNQQETEQIHVDDLGSMTPTETPEEAVITDESRKHMYLYEEDMKRMPRVSTFLKTLMVAGSHTTYPSEREEKSAKRTPKKAKLGLLLGVYLPTIQHILGLLIFIRHAWTVGCTGVLEGFFMVFMCCLTTFLTSISVSAIATNGMVLSGGSYYMLSRNLGPECGGSIGICFYLANTFATCLYLLGAIELLLLYIAPEIAFFGDVHHDPWNNFRFYGTIFLLALTLIVAVGVKFVQLFAPISLACVLISILSIAIGCFLADSSVPNSWICLLGDRLMASPKHGHELTNSSGHYDWCSRNETGDLWRRYCLTDNGSVSCDPFFEQNEPRLIPGIPGMSSGVINRNAFSVYMSKGDVTPGVEGDKDRGEVVSDITTTFVVLCAIYFPSVTGILTGANMSGDLRDPQKSIPAGTILAQLTCSSIFLTFVFLYASTTEGILLRDKFGASIDGNLIAALLAWPSPWVVLIGAFSSSVGAALQCLTSAPRLLQAIARDDIIPFLSIFKATSRNGEPLRALVLTFLLAEIGMIIANLDSVAPIIDVFFLMCYLFVNVICMLQTLLKTPNWRPRFRYYHWSLSLLGVILNFALCIIAGWYFALSAFAVAAFIYKYIQYKGGEKEWGDGIRGLTMSTAQQALLGLEDNPHTKNWRPQILVLTKADSDLEPEKEQMFSLATQLKAGKGLTVIASVLEGDYVEKKEDGEKLEKTIKEKMKQQKLKGFAKVVVCSDIKAGLNMLIQSVGLGGLRHNTVMLGWPQNWKENMAHSCRTFMEMVRVITAKGLSVLIPKGVSNLPYNKDRLTGTIDVWWIVHDGGLLILLAFLLQKHKVWRGCRLRIFTVAQLTDNSIQIKKDLETFLYQIRISAEVHVEEMYDSDISAYTVEKTLDMERRLEMMNKIQLARRGTLNNLIGAGLHHVRSTSPEKHFSRQQSQRSPSQSPTTSLTTPRLMSDVDGRDVQFTFSASAAKYPRAKPVSSAQAKTNGAQNNKPNGKNRLMSEPLLRMHNAVQLNQTIKNLSSAAGIIIMNFPAPPLKMNAEENYMDYLEALTEGLDRVLLVKGSGTEVVTIYS